MSTNNTKEEINKITNDQRVDNLITGLINNIIELSMNDQPNETIPQDDDLQVGKLVSGFLQNLTALSEQEKGEKKDNPFKKTTTTVVNDLGARKDIFLANRKERKAKLNAVKEQRKAD